MEELDLNRPSQPRLPYTGISKLNGFQMSLREFLIETDKQGK